MTTKPTPNTRENVAPVGLSSVGKFAGGANLPDVILCLLTPNNLRRDDQ